MAKQSNRSLSGICNEVVEPLILVIRNQKVILDRDLATLYGVNTKALNQAVRRNIERFPADFMFQLSEGEKAEVVTNCDHLSPLRFSRNCPFAFTEHGTIMAANVLNSERAIEASVFVVRAFVNLRRFAMSHQELLSKLTDIDRRLGGHDASIQQLISAVRQIMAPPKTTKRVIGFHAANEPSEKPQSKRKGDR